MSKKPPRKDEEPDLPDPQHDKMRAEGYSWVELLGGPKDGMRSYFVGPPEFWLAFVDPGVDPAKYKPGDLEHKYTLSPGPDGRAVYRWGGTFRRSKN